MVSETPKKTVVSETFALADEITIEITVKVPGDAPLDDLKAHMAEFASQVDLTMQDHLEATRPRQAALALT